MMFDFHVIVLNILVMLFALIGAVLSAISTWVYGKRELRKSPVSWGSDWLELISNQEFFCSVLKT